MDSGFSTFKALFFGLVGLFVLTAAVPSMTGGNFDALRRIGTSRDTLPGKVKKTSTSTGSGSSTTTTTTDPITTNSGYPELSMVPSNFDVNTTLTPSWGTGAIPGLNPGNTEGAFRFICGAGQLLRDDPIVYPGQPGKSHLHQFYGNTTANAYSTYQSLRQSGDSTCNNMGNGTAANRSAYWMPAMLNGRGQVVKPDYVAIYYKGVSSASTACTSMGKACIPLPNGLRFIFGYNMTNPGDGVPLGYFNCDGPGAVPGHYPDIVTAAQNCPPGARLGAILTAPVCWNGKDLDSPDHRSHVAYGSYGWWGYFKCPDTHPYVIPTFTLGVWYTVDDTLDRSGTWEAGKTVTWSLSSDNMPGMAPSKPGTTFHADWFGGWDNTVMSMWYENCVTKMLDCSGGDLGNGKQLKGAQQPSYGWTNPNRLVPVPG